ncbi:MULTISPECIES: ABC transporter substrate-binding protein [unclassified Haematobacter]|uniref:ABC transporter substrate-binding protein n=1 Tax=unclassified Haematobacter TaxID=2640585 RepID=UPI0025C56B07|nr:MULTISPECIES: extracellular solute-binding protein [unclassified Haematobacter]
MKHSAWTVALGSMGALMIGLSTEAQTLPDYYPADYSEIIEASRSEAGLMIYSNLSAENAGPMVAGFRQAYPWISVEIMDLAAGTLHSRWEAEAGSSARTADLLISTAVDRWVNYAAQGKLMDYQSPEAPHLPEFALPGDGIYVMSTDPMVLVYNTLLTPAGDAPTGVGDIARLAAEDPGTYSGRLTTYDPLRNAFGLSIWYAAMRDKGENLWPALDVIGPSIRGENSGGAQLDKVATGEYVASIYVSGIAVFPRQQQSGGEIYGVTFPDDGTPIAFRGMGIPSVSANPNSAKLFLDYALSSKGQTELGKGGVTPYRDDVPEAEIPFYTYQSIAEMVGEENLVLINFDSGMAAGVEAFTARWKQATGEK